MAAVCTPDQQQALPARRSWRTTPTSWATPAPSPTPAPITACRPTTIPGPAGSCKAERQGDEWILNGEKCFIANGGVAKLYLREHAHQSQRQPAAKAPPNSWCRSIRPGLRIGKIFNKSGWRFYQNGGAHLRERAGAARQPGGRGERRIRAAHGIRPRRSATSSSRRTRSASATRRSSWRRAQAQNALGRLALLQGQPDDTAPALRDAHAHRGAALVRAARRGGERRQGRAPPLDQPPAAAELRHRRRPARAPRSTWTSTAAPAP